MIVTEFHNLPKFVHSDYQWSAYYKDDDINYCHGKTEQIATQNLITKHGAHRMFIPATFEPMLSGKCPKDLTKIKYPILVSPKLDGIRCIIIAGVAMSRTLKPIPNLYVQEMLKYLPSGLDGELIVGKPTDPDVFNITQSGVMTVSGQPHFKFHIFDKVDFRFKVDDNETNLKLDFSSRFSNVNEIVDFKNDVAKLVVETVRHFRVDNAAQLQECADYYVGLGYEGIMIRSLNGPYKCGRSTEKEGYLLKYKPFQDADAIIVGVEELMHNNNEAIKDEFGRTKRSSNKANLIAGNTMGKLNCQLENGINFDIGTGFTDEMRASLWANKVNLIGQKIKFKYQNLTAKGKPRLPVFLSFRKD